MSKKLLPAIKLALVLMTLSSGAVAQEYYMSDEPETGHRPLRRLDLSFSIAEGGYINYRCNADTCDSAFVAPFDFEILAGFRVTRFLSVDVALNFSFDYYGYHYYTDAPSEVFVWTSLRPGIRLLLPTFFHQQVYFRAAVPLTFRLRRFNQGDDVFLPGLLFGVGIEWVWGGFGFFIEGDILPYFVAVYPDYYIIPVEGRFGVVAHF